MTVYSTQEPRPADGFFAPRYKHFSFDDDADYLTFSELDVGNAPDPMIVNRQNVLSIGYWDGYPKKFEFTIQDLDFPHIEVLRENNNINVDVWLKRVRIWAGI